MAIEPDSAAAPAPAAPPTHRGPWAGLLLPVLWMLLLLGLVVGGIVGAAAWLLRSEAGAAWLLARVPGVQVSGWRGPLLGDGAMGAGCAGTCATGRGVPRPMMVRSESSGSPKGLSLIDVLPQTPGAGSAGLASDR
jgi:uncharacterized iron-regulated membrane protein